MSPVMYGHDVWYQHERQNFKLSMQTDCLVAYAHNFQLTSPVSFSNISSVIVSSIISLSFLSITISSILPLPILIK